MTSDELMRACDLWAEMFAEDDTTLVAIAVKSLIKTLEFPPTIADVKKEMAKLSGAVSDEDLAIDEWNAIKRALSNSIYGADAGFDNLPPIAKRFVGSAKQLRQWGMSEDFNDGVVRGQFLKQYTTLKEREEYKKMLDNNPQLQELISNLSNQKLIGTKE